MTSEDEVLGLVKEYRLRPNRLRGQHFLIDDEVYEKILETAKLSARDTVLEVGPGLGTLTSRLAEKSGKVVAVEVEEKFAAMLRHRFQKQKNVSIVEGDILKLPVASTGIADSYKVVANIPYYLTGKLLRKFLADDTKPTAMVLLIQREVAERLVAKAGSLSMVGLSAQVYSQPRLVCFVQPTSFFPPPKVDSTVVAFDNVRAYPFSDVAEKFFWRVARIGFASPRKQLKNNLAAGFLSLTSSDIDEALKQAKVFSRARAQELEIEDWHRLAKVLEPKNGA